MSVFHAFGLLFCLVGVLSAQSFPVEKIAVGKFLNTWYVIIYCLLFFYIFFFVINLFYVIIVVVNYCSSLYIFWAFLRVLPFYCFTVFCFFLARTQCLCGWIAISIFSFFLAISLPLNVKLDGFECAFQNICNISFLLCALLYT